MQDVKDTGECTPMTKSTCTGRKKAFAKRAQKGGDLYSGNAQDDEAKDRAIDNEWVDYGIDY